MILNDESEKKLRELSFPLRQAANTLIRFLDRILNGNCSEDDVAKFMANKDMQEKSYSEGDYISVDMCCSKRYLNCTRNYFYDYYVKKYKLVNHKFNNVPIGYDIKEIISIKNKEKE